MTGPFKQHDAPPLAEAIRGCEDGRRIHEESSDELILVDTLTAHPLMMDPERFLANTAAALATNVYFAECDPLPFCVVFDPARFASWYDVGCPYSGPDPKLNLSLPMGLKSAPPEWDRENNRPMATTRQIEAALERLRARTMSDEEIEELLR